MIGGGYVGLVSGACFAEFGTDVIVVESDPGKLAALRDGRMPIYEPGLEKLYDPHDSFPILVDLRPSSDSSPNLNPGPDSISYELGYDNLFGDYLSYTDSSALPTDPGERLYYLRPGLRIRIVCSASRPGFTADPKILLQLLEYGIAHFAMLKQMHALCLLDGADPGKDPGPLTLVPQDIAHILAKPPSPKIRSALKTCF